jgi:hypothetical protein
MPSLPVAFFVFPFLTPSNNSSMITGCSEIVEAAAGIVFRPHFTTRLILSSVTAVWSFFCRKCVENARIISADDLIGVTN